MTKEQMMFHQCPLDRRQPLLDPEDGSTRSSHRFAEVAGGTTAECAAVVCCFPCALVNFLVLAVYKVPAGLCKKALRKTRRRRLLKKGMLISGRGAGDISSATHRISIDGAEYSIHPAAVSAAERFVMKSMEADKELAELEDEMWDKFYGTGFWRSLSQRVE